MFVFDNAGLNKYKRTDRIIGYFNFLNAIGRCKYSSTDYEASRWLRESIQKRFIYINTYLNFNFPHYDKPSLLDVGGGYTTLTQCLIAHFDYALLDCYIKPPKEIKHIFQDWYDYKLKTADTWDYIIANDIFPNVDQRLELFMDKYKDRCKKMILNLTYYNKPKWYKVIRADDTAEKLVMSAWQGKQLGIILSKYDKTIQSRFDFDKKRKSIFTNGRIVVQFIYDSKLKKFI